MASYGIEIVGLGGRHGGTDEDMERAADAVRDMLAPIPQADADAMRAAWAARDEGEDHDPALAAR